MWERAVRQAAERAQWQHIALMEEQRRAFQIIRTVAAEEVARQSRHSQLPQASEINAAALKHRENRYWGAVWGSSSDPFAGIFRKTPKDK